jgi:hypothetical protein
MLVDDAACRCPNCGHFFGLAATEGVGSEEGEAVRREKNKGEKEGKDGKGAFAVSKGVLRETKAARKGVQDRPFSGREWRRFVENCAHLRLAIFGVTDGATRDDKLRLRRAQDQLAVAVALAPPSTAFVKGQKALIPSGLLSEVERVEVRNTIKRSAKQVESKWKDEIRQLGGDIAGVKITNGGAICKVGSMGPYTLTTHSLHTHYTLTVHSLHTHYTPTVHSLYTHCTPTVYPLYTHYTPTTHSLYTHYTLTVHHAR